MKRKIRCKKGLIGVMEFIIILPILVGILFIALEILRHQARISDLQQMADMLSSHISDIGRVDSSTDDYLSDLENTFNMQVEFDFIGNINGTKIPLETPFEVKLTYNEKLEFGINETVEAKEYVVKSIGITEKYHK